MAGLARRDAAMKASDHRSAPPPRLAWRSRGRGAHQGGRAPRGAAESALFALDMQTPTTAPSVERCAVHGRGGARRDDRICKKSCSLTMRSGRRSRCGRVRQPGRWGATWPCGASGDQLDAGAISRAARPWACRPPSTSARAPPRARPTRSTCGLSSTWACSRACRGSASSPWAPTRT